MKVFIRKSAIPVIVRIVFLEIILFTLEFLSRFLVYQLLNSAILFDQFLVSMIILVLFQGFNLYVITKLILKWASEFYIIEGSEITFIRGILSKNVISYDVKSLQTISIQQNWFERLLNYGTVKLYSPVLKSDLFLHEVPDPIQIAEGIGSQEKQSVSILRTRSK